MCLYFLFDNMALYFECQINKNELFQIVFLAILPTRYGKERVAFITVTINFIMQEGGGTK